MRRDLSREYLEEALAESRRLLPGWAYALIHRAAMPRSGGRASARDSEPSILEHAALVAMQDDQMQEYSDDDIMSIHKVIGRWDAAAKKKKRPTDSIMRASLIVTKEMERRSLSAPNPDIVPIHGPDGAMVAFVGESPGPIDAARGQPLTGPEGATFRDEYLVPLGMGYDEVLKMNVVPVPLVGADGKPRRAGPEDIKGWSGWLTAQLDQLKPRVVVALGKTARDALGDRAGFMLPHPSAVRRFGNSGEVERKIKAIKKAIRKATNKPADKKPNPAVWHDELPASGAGDFVIGKSGIRLMESGGQGGLSLAIDPKGKADQDFGTYQLGICCQDSLEIFLDGTHHKGRYLVMQSQAGGVRKSTSGAGADWLIEKPDDQTPSADLVTLGDSIAEAKRKRQKFLIWGKPGERPRKIDVSTGKEETEKFISISKADVEKRIVYGVVLDPYQVDLEGDWSPPGVIEDTAHEWLRKSRVIGVEHGRAADAYPVESSIMPYPSGEDYRKALKGQPHRAYRMPFGDDTVHSGAWVVGTKLGPREWALHLSGEIDAYSIGGYAHRTDIDRRTMPEVVFVDLTVDQTPVGRIIK